MDHYKRESLGASLFLLNYAIKVQMAYGFHYRKVHVSECYHGSIHDITVLQELGLLEHVEDSVKIIGDNG